VTEVNWLTLSANNGTLYEDEETELELIFNTNEIAMGEYSCQIVLTDNTFIETIIPVTLTVNSDISVKEYIVDDQVLIFPNPFSHETSIYFNLKNNQAVNLAIYDAQGKKVKTLINQELPGGNHHINWDGYEDNLHKMPNGIYYCRLNSNRLYTGKIILIR